MSRPGALKPLNEEMQKRLQESLSDRDQIIYLVLLDSGLSIGDLLEAKVSDLDLDRGVLRLGSKEIRLSPKTTRELERLLNLFPGRVYLLEGRCGKPVTPKWIRCILEPSARKLGLDEIIAR